MLDAKEYLEELPFWKNLTDLEKKQCEKYAQIRTYEYGNVVHSVEQECLGFIKVLSGRVRTIMISDEGREIMLYQMDAGDTDVLSAACIVSQIRFETAMIADTDCKILVIPAVYLSELKETNLAVRCVIYERLTERFSDVVSRIQQTLFIRIDSRIASFLLDNIKDRTSKTVYITHEELARQINSSREVATRTLKEMKETGALNLKRGKIEVLDQKKLALYLK